MNVKPYPIDAPGAVGIIRDRSEWQIISEAWTDGKNFEFVDGLAKRVGGYTSALGDPTGAPIAIFNIPYTNNTTFWVVFTLAKAYVWESGVENDITNVSADYTTTDPWMWNGTLLAGIPIFNNGKDVPQWWSAVSISQELTDLTNWPSGYRCRVIRSFGPYLIAINLTESGTNKPHKVLISHKADPGAVPSSWNVSDATKEATQFELTDAEGGELLDGLALGSQFIFYKKNSTHTMRYVGGQDIWARDILFENSGILGTRCVCTADKGRRHFVATQNDLVMHSGTRDSLESIVEGKNRSAIFSEMDDENFVNAYVFEDEKKKLVYFCYPTIGNTYANKAYVFNYDNKTHSFRDWAGNDADKGVIQVTASDTWANASGTWDTETDPWAAAGNEGILIADPAGEAIYRLNSGYAFGGQTPIAFLERTWIPKPPQKKEDRADFTSRKMCVRVWPKMVGSTTCSVQVGAMQSRTGEVTWATATTFDPATMEFVDPDVPPNGRGLAIRFEFQANAALTIEGYDMEIAVLGKL